MATIGDWLRKWKAAGEEEPMGAQARAKVFAAAREAGKEALDQSQALARACQAGQERLARDLLAGGATAGDLEGRPAWSWAMEKAPGVFLEVARGSGEALAAAAMAGRLDWVEGLAKEASREALHEAALAAARAGHATCVEVLASDASPQERERLALWAFDSQDAACVERLLAWAGPSEALAQNAGLQAIRKAESPREAMKRSLLSSRRASARAAGSMAMLEAVARACAGHCMERALGAVASGHHCLAIHERLAAAKLLATPSALAAWERQNDKSLVSLALEAGDVEMARMMFDLGASVSAKDAPLGAAMAGASAQALTWALALERGWPEGLADRCAHALLRAPTKASPGLAQAAVEVARECSAQDLATVVVAMVAGGVEEMAKALLPVCDMGEVGALALGALAKPRSEEFAATARSMARSIAQSQSLAAVAAPAPSSSPGLRL